MIERKFLNFFTIKMYRIKSTQWEILCKAFWKDGARILLRLKGFRVVTITRALKRRKKRRKFERGGEREEITDAVKEPGKI